MGKWTDADTAKETGDSLKQVAEAEHQAREDATRVGLFERGNSEKNSQRFPGNDDTAKEAKGFFSRLFGSSKYDEL